MEEKIDLILKYFVVSRIKENVSYQMQFEMSQRKYDHDMPPKAAPLYDAVAQEEAEIIKQMADLIQFDFTEVDNKVKEDVRNSSSVQESRDTDSNIILP